MKRFKEDFIEIYQKERGLLLLILLNLIISIVLFIFTIIKINPNSAVVKIGYGDIGGYRDGTWGDMLAFPILAVLFGIVHIFLTLRLYRKRGSGMAKFLLITTTVLILGTFLVYLRLLKEA
jgi:hypothetical protein